MVLRLKYFSLSVILLFLIINSAAAQNPDSLSLARAGKEKYKPLRLERSDELEQQLINGVEVLKATGDVAFSQDTLSASCDQAAFFRDRQIAVLMGHVVLFDKHRTIFSERARYYAKQKKAVCEGNVLFVDGRTTLVADSLVYFQNIEQLTARGRVVIYDSLEEAASYGEEGFYDVRKKYSYVKGNPYMIQYDSVYYKGQNIARLSRGLPAPPLLDSTGQPARYDPHDQIVIRGRFVESYIDSHIVFVRDSASLTRDLLHATSGLAVYHTKKEILELHTEPRASYGRSLIFGDSMTVHFEKREIRSIAIRGKAQASTEADSVTRKRNRLEAKNILMNIQDRKLKTMLAEGNAYNAYYLENDEGVNEITGPAMELFFNNDSKLERFLVRGGSEGTYFPKAFEHLRKNDYH